MFYDVTLLPAEAGGERRPRALRLKAASGDAAARAALARHPDHVVRFVQPSPGRAARRPGRPAKRAAAEPAT